MQISILICRESYTLVSVHSDIAINNYHDHHKYTYIFLLGAGGDQVETGDDDGLQLEIVKKAADMGDGLRP